MSQRMPLGNWGDAQDDVLIGEAWVGRLLIRGFLDCRLTLFRLEF